MRLAWGSEAQTPKRENKAVDPCGGTLFSFLALRARECLILFASVLFCVFVVTLVGAGGGGLWQTWTVRSFKLRRNCIYETYKSQLLESNITERKELRCSLQFWNPSFQNLPNFRRHLILVNTRYETCETDKPQAL